MDVTESGLGWAGAFALALICGVIAGVLGSLYRRRQGCERLPIAAGLALFLLLGLMQLPTLMRWQAPDWLVVSLQLLAALAGAGVAAGLWRLGGGTAQAEESVWELRRNAPAEDARNVGQGELERRLDELTEALRRSEDNLEKFSYMVSHDLQEPVRMVVGFSQLLQRRYAAELPEQAREFVDMTASSAQRMSQMLQDLLILSRLDRTEIGDEPVELDEAFERGCAAISGAIAESGAQIEAEPLPVVVGNRDLLSDVFRYLLDNAIKYRGDAPPKIRVRASRDGQFWELCVSDQGIGLDPKFSERVFLPFQRLHTQSEYPGTGIGLALVRRIVERHGGRVWVESAPGEGASFYFTLRAAETSAADVSTMVSGNRA